MKSAIKTAQAHGAVPARTRAAQDRPWDSTRGSKSSAPSQGQGLPTFGQQRIAGHGLVAHTAAQTQEERRDVTHPVLEFKFANFPERTEYAAVHG